MFDSRPSLIKSLFLKAAELPLGEREEFLLNECGQDEQLRNEVQNLLVHVDIAPDGFLEGTDSESGMSAESLSSIVDQHDEQGELLGIPEQFGKFNVVRLVGLGGMGVVYEATQEHPRRTVALKVLRPGLFAREKAKRFERERICSAGCNIRAWPRFLKRA